MEDKLRQDFPIDWEEDHYVSRREFFKFLTLASGGLAVGTAALAVAQSWPQKTIRFEEAFIAKVEDVKVGEALQFSYPRPQDLCILVRRSAAEVVAYKRRCTHLSCPVEWQPEQDRLFCPCHNGAFSIEDGHVLQGPPPSALPRIDLTVRNGQIYATGVSLAEKQA